MSAEELGMLFELDERKVLRQIAVRPVDFEEATNYTLASIQAQSFYNDSPPMTALYWIPFSAFVPLKPTGAEALTPKHLEHDPDDAPPPPGMIMLRGPFDDQ